MQSKATPVAEPETAPWNSPEVEELTRRQRALVGMENALARRSAERERARRERRY